MDFVFARVILNMFYCGAVVYATSSRARSQVAELEFMCHFTRFFHSHLAIYSCHRPPDSSEGRGGFVLFMYANGVTTSVAL